MATLHLMVGLPGSGKITYAKELEQRCSALRLTPDEWQFALFGHDMEDPEHDRRHTRIEELMWKIAARVLELGRDVILDFGCWAREEREDFRNRAASLGADFRMYYMDVSLDELFRRLSRRNLLAGREAVFRVSREDLEQWAALFQIPGREEGAKWITAPSMAGSGGPPSTCTIKEYL